MNESPNNKEPVTANEILAELEELCKPDGQNAISFAALQSKFPEREIPSSSIYGAIGTMRKKLQADKNALDQFNARIEELELESKKKEQEEPAKKRQPIHRPAEDMDMN